MTRRELIKKYPANSVMVTREFGYPIFIAPLKNLADIEVTDKVEEAEKWSPELDGTKLAYHKAVTGFKGLAFEAVT